MIGEQEVGKSDDRGQNIVEIMRDAAGELADRLQLLALSNLLFEHALLGNVDTEHQCSVVPILVAGKRADEQAAGSLAFRGADVDRRNGSLARRGLVHRLVKLFAGCLVHELIKARCFDTFVRAEEARKGEIAAGDAPVLGNRCDRNWGRSQETDELVDPGFLRPGVQTRAAFENHAEQSLVSVGGIRGPAVALPGQQHRDGHGRPVAFDNVERER